MHQWCLTIAPGEKFEDVTRPDFWMNAPMGAMGMRQGDAIAVHHHAYYAELYVRRVQEADVRSGAKAGAVVAVTRFHSFDALPTAERTIDFQVRFLGPGSEWGVIRLSDGKTMLDGLPDKDVALKHAAGLQAAKS
jgi:hypothetical protein